MYKCWGKRLLDVVLSFLSLLMFSPLILFLFIIGAVIMKGNPLLSQLRPGKNEKLFPLLKFRTMTNELDQNGNLLPDSIRVTRYGRILRSTSLDEIPELINILIGQMSIVGPRPLLVEYLPYYTLEEHRRHDVRPGLTGLAQINGRNASSWESKFRYDLEYVDNITLGNDFRIIFLTISKVFFGADILVGDQIPAGRLDNYRKNTPAS